MEVIIDKTRLDIGVKLLLIILFPLLEFMFGIYQNKY